MFDLGMRYYDYGQIADEIDIDASTAPLGHSMNNMKAFIRDLEAGPMEGFYSLHYEGELGQKPKGNRFQFTLSGVRSRVGYSPREGCHFNYSIRMPGLHIQAVRYVRDQDQHEYDFAKVVIEGVPRTWIDALEHINQETR